jgi:hypothetical protein
MAQRHWLSLLLALFLGSVVQAADPDVSTKVDAELRAAWKARQIEPASSVDDAGFLRRAYLDITGTLPSPEKVVQFLDDRSSDKRARVVDELVRSKAYAARWSTYWDNILMGRLTAEAFIDRGAFRKWLHQQFEDNTPWNRLVHELVSAEGYNTDKRPKNAQGDPDDMAKRYNPATNWFLRYSKSLPELSGATAKTFLGVQIQCAQCHDHKSEKWTQNDFKQFTACFAKTWGKPYDRNLVVGIHRVDTTDHLFVPPTTGKLEAYFSSYKDYVDPTPRLLDGTQVGSFRSRRLQLANWMTAKNNPWFAKAIVNRMWALFLGRGFVEPVDDLRPGNPPEVSAALDALANDFVANGYDLRHLVRAICATEAYQLSARVKSDSATEPALWSSYPLKQLDIEVLLDVIVQAADAEAHLDKLAKGNFELVRNAFIRQFVTQMGTDDMAEATAFEETVPLALMLLNGALTNGTTRMTAGLGLDKILKSTSNDKERIEKLYLHALSRRPTPAEMSQWVKYVNKPREVAKTPGPPTNLVTGLRALTPDKAIMEAGSDSDFKELLKHAKTAADFQALYKRMKNNADAALYVKAFNAWAADVPFQYLTMQGGGDTPKEQAFENLYWALLNCSEFLTNH